MSKIGYIPARLVKTRVADKAAQLHPGESYLSGTFRMDWLDAADDAGPGCLRLALHLLRLVKMRKSDEVVVNQSQMAEAFGWHRSKLGRTFRTLRSAHLVTFDGRQGRFLHVQLNGHPIVKSPKRMTPQKTAQ